MFIPQSLLDTWVTADEMNVDGDLVLLRRSGIALRLSPASLFLRVSAGSDEAHALVGRVKDEAAVAALAGEAYLTSVILGETAYEVEPGFVAAPVGAVDGAELVRALRGMAG